MTPFAELIVPFTRENRGKYRLPSNDKVTEIAGSPVAWVQQSLSYDDRHTSPAIYVQGDAALPATPLRQPSPIRDNRPSPLLLPDEHAYISAFSQRGRNASICPHRCASRNMGRNPVGKSSLCHRSGPARPGIAGRGKTFLRADRAARATGGGQRLCRQGGAEPQSAARRCDLPPFLWRAGPAAGTDAALAGLGGDGGSVRSRRDQRPCH